MSNNTINARLSNFQIVKPKYFLKQSDAINWNAEVHQKYDELYSSENEKKRNQSEMEKIFQRFSCSEDKINKRGFELPDMASGSSEENLVYPSDLNHGEDSHGANIGKKMKFFVERSSEVFETFYPKEAIAPDQIIHVTCTGYVSPSAPQRIVNQNNWQSNTGVTHAYHMGCYASLPAVRMGEGMVVSNGYRLEEPYSVDVVHTEICSLHMNPRLHSPEQIVIQSLFADGHIKYSMSHGETKKPAFKVEAVSEYIIPNSSEMMSWAPTFWGMNMVLSRRVPAMIRDHIKPFLESLIAKTEYKLEDVLKNAIFAVHPGGPKIIDEVQQNLELSEDQVKHSQKVLQDRGNMSSATLPHVWKSILEDKDSSGKVVVSLAFGPGLTVFGSIYSVES